MNKNEEEHYRKLKDMYETDKIIFRNIVQSGICYLLLAVFWSLVIPGVMILVNN